MKEEQDIELIEQYINNNLDKTERERVDVRLRMESDFVELFKDVEILLHGVKVATRRQLVGELKSIEQNLPSTRKKVILFPKTYWWIGAAASVALIVLIFSLWNNFVTPASEKLFAEYYEPYPNVVIPSIRGANVETDMALALQNYEQKEYSNAIEKLEGIENKGPDVFFYLGSSYLASDNTAKAILNFEKCLQSNNELNTQAEWYLALCYLDRNDLESCVPMLRTIASKNNPYSSRATEILSKLQME